MRDLLQCKDCMVRWRGPDPCWVCGEQGVPAVVAIHRRDAAVMRPATPDTLIPPPARLVRAARDRFRST